MQRCSLALQVPPTQTAYSPACAVQASLDPHMHLPAVHVSLVALGQGPAQPQLAKSFIELEHVPRAPSLPSFQQQLVLALLLVQAWYVLKTAQLAGPARGVACREGGEEEPAVNPVGRRHCSRRLAPAPLSTGGRAAAREQAASRSSARQLGLICGDGGRQCQLGE